MKKFLYVLSLHSPANLANYFRDQWAARYASHSRLHETSCPIVLSLAILFTIFAPAQAAVIHGKVNQFEDGSPIEGANIQLVGTHLGAATGKGGDFIIHDVPAGTYTVTASYLGLEGDRAEVTVSDYDTSNVSLKLTESYLNLGEVVFTATRTLQALKDVPIATEVVTSRDIKNSAAINAAEALASEIGLEVQEDFSGQGVTLQGVDPNKILILVDGNRVIGRVNGSIDLEQVATDDIKQIEVVKGAVSTLYGSEAIGGVINIITERANQPFTLDMDMSGGGFFPNRARSIGSGRYSGGAKLGVRNGKLGVKSSVRATHRGVIDLNPSTAHTEGSDGSDRLNFDVRTEYNDFWGPTSLIVGGRYVDESKHWQEDSGIPFLNLYYDDEETNSRFDFSSEILCEPNHHDRYSLKVYRSDSDHLWEKIVPASRRVKDYSEGLEDYTEVSGLLTNDLFDNHLVTLGADHYWWDIEANSELGGVQSHESATLTAWALYLQDEWKMLDQLTLIPGFRHEQHEIYGANESPRLSVMYKPDDNFKIRASVGKGYRAPSSKELYFDFNHSSAGYVVLGNEDLLPEESTSYTVSFEHNYGNSSVARLSLFYNDMRNLIDFDSLYADEDFYLGVYRYENIFAAWTRGFEIERGFRYNPDLRFNLSYGYLETRNLSTGEQLLRRPTHSGRWDITWTPGDWTMKVWGKYVAKMLYTSIWQADDQSSQEFTDPYTLWNFTLTRDITDDLDVYTRVENLTDHSNARYGPYVGRTMTLGMRWRVASLN